MLSLREAAIGYGDAVVLRDVALDIAPGERVALLGRSGAGKTTLLKRLFDLTRGAAALIPQDMALVRSLSVMHNIYMGRLDRFSVWTNLRTLVWPARTTVAAICEIAARVGLEDKLHKPVGDLSGGQRQRAAVGRALYNGRPIVIGDEPVSAVDRLQGRHVLDELGAVHETVVLALHDVELALSFATRIVGLDGGRIVLDAPCRSLAASDLAPLYQA